MKIKLILAVLSAFLLLGVAFDPTADQSQAQATDVTQSDKYDGDCTGDETAGRCANKCQEGYFWRGGCVRVTGCPYGDSIPLGAECDKHKPVEAQEPYQPQSEVEGK